MACDPTKEKEDERWPVEKGVKDDDGKNRVELIPPELIFAVGSILTFGATKYSDRNWEQGILFSRVFGAMMRHAWAWWGGEDTDPETGKSHLWHAACCVSFLIAYEARRMAQFDDRPTTDSEKADEADEPSDRRAE